MKKELDDALCKDFPLTFRDRNASMQVTCMCWGFPGDGWEPLIRRAAEKIEAEIRKMPTPGPEDMYCTSSQVKQKFGTLRWYMTCETPEIYAAIQEAMRASSVTCERCGSPGRMRGDAYYNTLCDACSKA